MQKASKLNPYYPWWINGGFSFYYLHKKEYAAALFWAEKMNSDETFLGPLLKSVTHSFLGNREAAAEYLLKLVKMEPEKTQEITNMLSTFLISEELINEIIGELERIGFHETAGLPARRQAADY